MLRAGAYDTGKNGLGRFSGSLWTKNVSNFNTSISFGRLIISSEEHEKGATYDEFPEFLFQLFTSPFKIQAQS